MKTTYIARIWDKLGWKDLSPEFDCTADACEWVEKHYSLNEKQSKKLWENLRIDKFGKLPNYSIQIQYIEK